VTPVLAERVTVFGFRAANSTNSGIAGASAL
jgi:hypothetical protein